MRSTGPRQLPSHFFHTLLSRREGPIEIPARRVYRLPLRGGEVRLGERTLLMGVLNVTPDSFSDGGRLAGADAAVARGLELFAEGADWVDVGGESTRPGAARVPADEELRRVVPVVEGLRARGAGPVSIDTSKSAVARAALDAGADIVNDVSALRYDPAMTALVAERRVPAVLMHLRGPFEAMHRSPAYHDVMGEVVRELGLALVCAERSGVARDRLLVDPGLGFSKTAEHSLEALRRLPEMASLDRPVLVGPSRKRFIGRLLDLPVERRLMGTAAAVATAVLLGAHVVRVHDVAAMAEVVKVADAVRGERAPTEAA
ncbi:MAG TPA: dihydropteroate synthase [Vicinamibacteria bacterium]|nr:dihydropteroate synthase [Vicinamibacteria bacterium]